MEILKLKKDDIKLHNVVIAITTKPDYEMTRWMLLEPLCNDELNKKTNDRYIICEGYHCSCYNFDDTKWEYCSYTKEELNKLVEAKLKKQNYWYHEEKQFYELIKDYLAGE